jgi:TDG/mug DNA glycosylase family protein
VTRESLLPDVLVPGLRVVFCGTAAGTQSALKQAYYAGRGNRFWSVLHLTALTPHLLKPAEFRLLAEYGIGLTDVCKTHSGMDKEIPGGAFAPLALERKLLELQPGVIAFNGKKAAQIALRRKQSTALSYGPQSELFGRARVWVLPSTSGAANGHWGAGPWEALASSLPAPAVAS